MYVQVVIRAKDHTFASVNDVIFSSSLVTSSKLGSLKKAGRIAGKNKFSHICCVHLRWTLHDASGVTLKECSIRGCPAEAGLISLAT